MSGGGVGVGGWGGGLGESVGGGRRVWGARGAVFGWGGGGWAVAARGLGGDGWREPALAGFGACRAVRARGGKSLGGRVCIPGGRAARHRRGGGGRGLGLAALGRGFGGVVYGVTVRGGGGVGGCAGGSPALGRARHRAGRSGWHGRHRPGMHAGWRGRRCPARTLWATRRSSDGGDPDVVGHPRPARPIDMNEVTQADARRGRWRVGGRGDRQRAHAGGHPADDPRTPPRSMAATAGRQSTGAGFDAHPRVWWFGAVPTLCGRSPRVGACRLAAWLPPRRGLAGRARRPPPAPGRHAGRDGADVR